MTQPRNVTYDPNFGEANISMTRAQAAQIALLCIEATTELEIQRLFLGAKQIVDEMADHPRAANLRVFIDALDHHMREAEDD